MHLQENSIFDRPLTLTLGSRVKVTGNIAQYPLNHVTYSATKFEVATSTCLGGDTFTRKYIIWSLTLTFESRLHEMLPSTLYSMWPIQLQSLNGRTDNVWTDFGTKLIYPFFLKKKVGIKRCYSKPSSQELEVWSLNHPYSLKTKSSQCHYVVMTRSETKF